MSRSDSPPHMFGYWREKYGYVDSLKQYYPNLLASRVDLQIAIAQIENAERAIDAVLRDLGSDEII